MFIDFLSVGARLPLVDYLEEDYIREEEEEVAEEGGLQFQVDESDGEEKNEEGETLQDRKSRLTLSIQDVNAAEITSNLSG